MDLDVLPYVSIVVIGKNEEKNLEDTFQAIRSMDYPKDKTEVIYVDTGSGDRSVEIAKKYTDKVFVEKSGWPTSGIARNKGLLEAKYDIIHFIDGDIAISKGYLKKAVDRIQQKKAEAVTGYFEEKYPAKFYNRLMAIRRDSIIHEERLCESTNGGGTYLKKNLLEVNGYDERILKGQESELGLRFRNNGNRILFIDVVQGKHDFDIGSTLDFIKAKFVYGKSSGYMLKIPDEKNEYIRNTNKAAKKLIVSNSLSLAVIFISLFINFLIIPAYYFLRVFLLVTRQKIIRKKSNRELRYALFQYIFSFATYWGILYVISNRSLAPGNKNILYHQKRS